MIEIEFEEEKARIGKNVRGTVSVHPQDSLEPETIRVDVGWRTEGRGDEARGSANVDNYPGRSVGPGSPFTGSFRARIPEEGPMSYNGNLIRVIWEVTVTLEIPWGRDRDDSESFWVDPEGS